MRRLFYVLAGLLATATVAAAVYATARGDALDRLAMQGRSDLALATDRLLLEMQRSRDVAVLLAADPRVHALIAGGDGAASDLLRGVADRAGATDLAVLRPGRRRRRQR